MWMAPSDYKTQNQSQGAEADNETCGEDFLGQNSVCYEGTLLVAGPEGSRYAARKALDLGVLGQHEVTRPRSTFSLRDTQRCAETRFLPAESATGGPSSG